MKEPGNGAVAPPDGVRQQRGHVGRIGQIRGEAVGCPLDHPLPHADDGHPAAPRSQSFRRALGHPALVVGYHEYACEVGQPVARRWALDGGRQKTGDLLAAIGHGPAICGSR